MNTAFHRGGELAPYALVRLTALPYPPVPVTTVPFRAAMASLADLATEAIAVASELVTLLHDSSGGHSVAFHQKVVLPLRRDVHNGRMPRPAVLAALGDLPQRVPRLAEWLAMREELDRRQATVARLFAPALAAERLVLAELCAAEPVRKAAALTGRDLLHGVDRAVAGADAPDRRTRKAEPTVLRFALRAAAKTSPLSWYTWVGWGTWSPGPGLSRMDGIPVAHARVNHAILARLTAALLSDPARRTMVPHRLAPAVHERDGRVFFRRDMPVSRNTRAYVLQEEAVDLPLSGPLRFVIDLVRAAGPKGISPADIVDTLALRLLDGRTAHAETYLGRLLDIGLLIPVAPVDPQDPDGATALSAWLRERDEHELADRFFELHSRTTAFGDLDADARPTALAGLEESWRVLAERTGADLTGVSPVREDVIMPEPIALGGDLGRDAGAALSRLMPLLMCFDRDLLVRRLIRDLFVARFGVGASARPAECADLVEQGYLSGATIARGAAGPEIAAFLAARERIATLVRAEGESDQEISDAAVDAATELLPGWATSRPASYSLFVQPLGGGLVVNQIYAGFGRFPSRFLDMFPAEARAAVTTMLNRTFGSSGFVQFRPVSGFNANLHPMLTDREIGEDTRWVHLSAESVEVCHDPDRDEIRLRHKDTGEQLDILYPGYLVPMSLPDRMAPLHVDLACGWVDLSSLRPTVQRDGVRVSGRLRYRDIVLGRKSWEFDAEAVRARFSPDGAACALAAAQLRARHDLPQHVFVGTGGSVTSRADFESLLDAPKPQYVDFANALHLRCLPRLLSRYERRIRLTEALPVPDGRVVELITETYWRPS